MTLQRETPVSLLARIMEGLLCVCGGMLAESSPSITLISRLLAGCGCSCSKDTQNNLDSRHCAFVFVGQDFFLTGFHAAVSGFSLVPKGLHGDVMPAVDRCGQRCVSLARPAKRCAYFTVFARPAAYACLRRWDGGVNCAM